jgi:hypothetical protein
MTSWRRQALQRVHAGLRALMLSGALGAATAQAATPQVTAVPGRAALSLGAFDLGALGYTSEEFFIRGQAQSYRLSGPASPDGRWTATPDATAAYATRVVAVRPADPARFNGTVVVEWLNVSGGTDGAADWLMAHRELARGGYAWIGVSAQKVGVEGGPSLGGLDQPLKKADPARYGGLSHPGDAFSFDIFSQAGRIARNRGAVKVLGPLAPRRLMAVGESQSATFLTTYVNAVAPLAKAFDGYLIHSRFGPAAGIDGASVIEAAPGAMPQHVRFRTDLRVPVITVLAESDVIGTRLPGYWSARQPDNEHLRTWEMAGAAHADTYVLQVAAIDAPATPPEKIAAAYRPSDSFFGVKLAKPVNAAPQHHYVVKAALAALDRWIRTGQAPSSAEPLQLGSTDPPALKADGQGLALGGVRTPWVDVPTQRLSGVGNSGLGPIGALFGVTEPFDQATLDRLYPGGKRDYLQRFEASLDRTIAAGFLLPADREEILRLADLMYPGSR